MTIQFNTKYSRT